MATHSSILACKIQWTKEPGGFYSPWCCKESDMAEHTHMLFSTSFNCECRQQVTVISVL